MNSEYEDFINSNLDNNNQLHIIFDFVFSKCMPNDESYEESSIDKFNEYLKEIFEKLEKLPSSQFEYNCKCILSILLNHKITPEMKQCFFQYIISYLSSMQKKIQTEIQNPKFDLNTTEILSIIMDIYENGLIDLYTSTRLSCGKFLTPIVNKYIKMFEINECHQISLMDKLLGILNNKTLQWQKYEGAIIGIYNLLLIQEFTDSLSNNDMHLLIAILFSRILSPQQSIRDWCVRVISIIFAKKGNSEELRNLLMETLKHLQPVNWMKISNDVELYSPSTPKTPVENYFQYNKYNKLPLLLNGSVDFTNYSCTLNCNPSHFDENINLNQYFDIPSEEGTSPTTGSGENYAIELEVKKTYIKPEEKQQERLEKADKPVLSPIQQQSLGISSGFNSNSFSSLASPSSPAKYSVTPVINNCELQFPLGGKSNIHQIEGLLLLLEFLVRYVDSLDINLFNSVFNISKYYLGHINPKIRQNASSLIKTLVINHHEKQEINILFIIHSLAAEWPIRGPLCSTNSTTEDNIPWEWKEGRLFVFEQLFKFLNNQQLHFITPTILKNSEGVSMRPGTSLKDRVLSLSKTNLKHLDTSIDSDLDDSSSQLYIGKNTQSLDQLINIEMLKNYESLMVTNSMNSLHQTMPISHEYDSGCNIKMLENLDITSSTFHSLDLQKKGLKIDTRKIQDNCSFYSSIRKRIPPHSSAMPNSPQVNSTNPKLSYQPKYNLASHSMHYNNSQHNMMSSGNNLSMRYKLQSIVRSANTKLNEPMYLKKDLNEFSNLQFHQQIMKILTFIFIQSTFESYNNKQGELKFISKHLIPVITEALLWVDVETSVQLIRDIINGFVDPRSTIIDKSSDSQKYILGLVLKALVIKAINLMELNEKRKENSNSDANLSFSGSGAMFGGGNSILDNNASSNTSDNDEWTYIEKIIEQIKTAIPDIVNFIYCMIDTMENGPTLTLSCEMLMLIRTHFRSNLVAQKSQIKRRFGSNFGLYETENEPCSMRRGLSSALFCILSLFKNVSVNTNNECYIKDKYELRSSTECFSEEIIDKWKAYINSSAKIPEELNISPLWKKDIINTTAPLWKTFINDLSAYEMLFIMPSIIDFMGESITHQIIYISAINQVLLRWGKLIQTDPTINQLIISKFKSEDSENTWNEDDDFDELTQNDWSESMDKICLQCIDELNLLVKHKNFTKKTLFLIINTMYICCMVMNTHLQKDAIKKIFSTLTMLMNEYDNQKRLSTLSSSTKESEMNCDMDKVFTDALERANSSLNFSDMELWDDYQETTNSVTEEADLSLTPIIINDIIKKLDHLSTILDKHKSNNDVVHCGVGDEKDESNTIHKYFDSLLIDAVKENPNIGNKLNKYLKKTDSQNIPC
ncbi:hypothetical protein BCR36DRAFT_332756 [Piromyces finnis]|uniref:Uncharacterized protein n=1 Tax=Piromyces finnis TaxID=1754191 RepID=A0A1Y1V2F2_9FUNG|nr:hypothetical protein BCR36DRAFT_332756 [Piromyces finnis]|eukprot:ORX45776.1 hypothetical protein BCR36DRAFT_332756 [Piromyces finnis]